MKLNMKLNAIAFAAFAILLGSCSSMDKIHEEYFELSNETYIGKPELTNIEPGYLRAKMHWTVNVDPRVEMTRFYWDTGAEDGKDTVYLDFLGEDSTRIEIYENSLGESIMSVVVGLTDAELEEFLTLDATADSVRYNELIEMGMPEGEYTVYIENLGDEDTKSLYTTYPVSVYGPNRIATLTSRPVSSAYITDEGYTYIRWGSADYCDGVTLHYYTQSDDPDNGDDPSGYYHNDEIDGALAAVDTLVLTDAMQDTKYWYTTHYKPEVGLDRISTQNTITRSIPFTTYYLTKMVTSSDVIFSSAIYLTYYDATSTFEYHNAYGEATDYSATYGREKLWDYTYSNSSSSSMEYYTGAETDADGNASSLSANRTISIDLGHEYRLTDFIFYQTASQSSGTARMFAQNNLKTFNLYGLGNEAMVDDYDSMTIDTSVTIDGVTTDFTRIDDAYISSTKIKDEYLKTTYINLSDPYETDSSFMTYIVPDLSNWESLIYGATASTMSGSDTASTDDINYAIEYGHTFSLTYDEPVRFVRLQLIDNWSSASTYFEMSEIDFIGAAVNDEGEILDNPFPIDD